MIGLLGSSLLARSRTSRPGRAARSVQRHWARSRSSGTWFGRRAAASRSGSDSLGKPLRLQEKAAEVVAGLEIVWIESQRRPVPLRSLIGLVSSFVSRSEQVAQLGAQIETLRAVPPGSGRQNQRREHDAEQSEDAARAALTQSLGERDDTCRRQDGERWNQRDAISTDREDTDQDRGVAAQHEPDRPGHPPALGDRAQRREREEQAEGKAERPRASTALPAARTIRRETGRRLRFAGFRARRSRRPPCAPGPPGTTPASGWHSRRRGRRNQSLSFQMPTTPSLRGSRSIRSQSRPGRSASVWHWSALLPRKRLRPAEDGRTVKRPDCIRAS